MGLGRLFGLALWVLAFVIGLGGIGLSIGGVGDIHKDCKDNGGRNKLLEQLTDERCDDMFRTVWWAILFGVVAMVLTLLAAITKQMRKTRVLVMVIAFVVMSAVDLMDATEEMLALNDDKFYRNIRGEEDSLKIGIAGLIAMSVASWLIIITATLAIEGESPAPPKGAPDAQPLA